MTTRSMTGTKSTCFDVAEADKPPSEEEIGLVLDTWKLADAYLNHLGVHTKERSTELQEVICTAVDEWLVWNKFLRPL